MTGRESATLVVERSDRFAVRVWGRDPVRMIQGLITNDLAGLERGAVYAAVLTPKGRMLADVRVVRRQREGAMELLLDLPRAASPGIEEHLKRFLPPMFARWEDISATEAVLGVYGAHAASIVRSALLPELPADFAEDAVHSEGEMIALGTAAAGEGGVDLVLPCSRAADVRRALVAEGGLSGGLEGFEQRRIEAGRPRFGPDMGPETIATEAFEATGLMSRAVSFGKGCYTGQEVIVRIAHRGHVNRHLRGLRLGDTPPPAHRTPLVDRESGREVGWVTSAVHSPTLGETLALGYVRREFAPGSEVALGVSEGPAAVVSELPFPQPE
jgi:folate-binding protein YgfZ